jgi:hypothetical protein
VEGCPAPEESRLQVCPALFDHLEPFLSVRRGAGLKGITARSCSCTFFVAALADLIDERADGGNSFSRNLRSSPAKRESF